MRGKSMGIINIYSKIKIASNNFFILDTYGNVNGEEEDFRNYVWETNRNNKIKEGDFFIYRRPVKASLFKEFYLFGSGRIHKINNLKEKKVSAIVSEGYKFNDYVFKRDLNLMNLEIQPPGDNWQRAFVQYGITQISEKDFFEILKYIDGKDLFDQDKLIYDANKKEIEDYKKEISVKIDSKNYRIEDKESIVKVRVGQALFAKAVKANYKNKCAVTGISNQDFLIASHIKPWAKDIDNRLNPRNGICLSVIYDKAFDKGYISFDDNFELIVSELIKIDPILYSELIKNIGKKINTYGGEMPGIDFLKWHRNNIFKYSEKEK
jgi:putative restriction endonuclease